jgi:putative endonuclease
MKKEIGKLGEKIAEDFLKKKGYQILDRNYKFQIPGDLQRGEIDIVAKKKDIICFVEVKTLKNPKIEIFPEEKVNFSKKRKIIFAAESWLLKNKIPLDTKWQIDVISILIKGDRAKIFHFENAVSDLRAR